ncbi:hypothetical protein ACTXJ3_10030 [Brachybacterium paraconglomeratum]|uniref:hypothetical protein n=1 Tax=Brachybacterium paraconglomeratum TaxID=173362 RepID=UPI003FD225C1
MTLPLWLQVASLLVTVALAVSAGRSARKAQAAEHEAARLRALEERVAERKYALYQPFLKSLGDTLTPSRKEQAVKGQEDAMADFQSFVTVWGSDEVVEKFYRFRVASAASPPSLVIMRLMSDFLLAVRRDIAWPSTELDGMHMIAMRINDIDEQPDMQRALTMPLDELFAWQEWTPNFEIRNIGEPTAKGRGSRA